jgi:hypothetical protein
MARLLSIVPHALLLLAGSLSAQAPIPEWRLGPAPILQLGGEDATGPTEFANPYAAAFLPDRLIILDGQSQVLRAFRLPDGQFIRSIGRRGSGPGEFMNAAYLQPMPGDSLFVADLVLSRYAVFDSAGHEARTVSLAAALPGVRLTPVGRLADGSLLAWAPRFEAITATGIQPLSATLYRVSPDGSSLDSLRTLPFSTVNAAPFQKGFGYRVLLGAGQLYPAVSGSVASFSSPSTYTLYRYTLAGQWQTIQEVRPVRLGTGADGERLRAEAVAQGASASYMATVPVIDTLPAIHYIVAAASGQLYVVENALGASRTKSVTVYDPAGRPIGRFTIPTALHLLAATDTQIAVTERDPESAPTIQIYTLIPR